MLAVCIYDFLCYLDLHIKIVAACQSGDISYLEELKCIQGEDVKNLILGNVTHSHKSKYGLYRPGDYVFIASEYNFPEVVDYLIDLGAYAEEPCTSITIPATPLTVASRKGNIEVRPLVFNTLIPH